MEDVHENENNDYEMLKKLKKISQLYPMAKAKNRSEEAKVRILSRVISGTSSVLSVLQRAPSEPASQRYINALCMSMREFYFIEEEKSPKGARKVEGPRVFFWRPSIRAMTNLEFQSQTVLVDVLRFSSLEKADESVERVV